VQLGGENGGRVTPIFSDSGGYTVMYHAAHNFL